MSKITDLDISTSKELMCDVECPIVTNEDGEPFIVTISALPIKEQRALKKKHTQQVWSKKTHQQEEKISDSWEPDYCKRVIKGWSGLTVDGLEELILGLKLRPEQREEWKGGVPYSPTLALNIMQNSADFDQWVWATCRDATLFQSERIKELDENFTDTSKRKRGRPPAE